MDIKLRIDGPNDQRRTVGNIIKAVVGEFNLPTKISGSSFSVTIKEEYGIVRQISEGLNSVAGLSYSYLWDPILGPDGKSWAVVRMQQREGKAGFLLSHEEDGLQWVPDSSLQFDVTLGTYVLPGAPPEPVVEEQADARWQTMADMMDQTAKVRTAKKRPKERPKKKPRKAKKSWPSKGKGASQ